MQQKTNQKLRELELSNAEKAGLLRTALLDRDNLTPELLEIMRAELLQRIREQIERVLQASSESRPQVLNDEAEDIAKTVMESQAALDATRKVSLAQICHSDGSSAFEPAVSEFRAKMSLSIASPPSVRQLSPFPLQHDRARVARKQSLSEVSASNAGTRDTTLGRLSQISNIFSRRRRASGVVSETLFSQPTSTVASSGPGVASSVPGMISALLVFPYYHVYCNLLVKMLFLLCANHVP